MEQSRETLPTFTQAADAIEAMRASLKNGSWLQYRRKGTRKVTSVDTYSMSACTQLWDKCSDLSRQRIQQRTEGDPLTMCQMAWLVLKGK